MDFLHTLLSFIVAISILVAVHEFGHFWVARKLGVKVLRYSIGFGKPIWRRTGKLDNTEYVVAAIPLGGYVKMLDEREGEVDESERHRAFNTQSVYKRFAIVLAGPMFNFLFALLAYWLMFVVGVNGIKPVVGKVLPDSPAAIAELKHGDEILSVNNKQTPIWDVVIQSLLPEIIAHKKVDIEIKTEQGVTVNRQLDFSASGAFEPETLFSDIGLYPWRPPVSARVGLVQENSPASQAGLQKGDHILMINNQRIIDWYDLVDYVSARPAQKLQLLIERNGKQLEKTLVTAITEVKKKKIGRIGVGPLDKSIYPDYMKIKHGYSMFDAIGQSISNTWSNSALMMTMLGKLVTGEVSLKNLSGPISIAVYAGQSASAGLARFLDLLAVVSISLGILNLLPIPILDGGHLMYYVIEIVRGRPVSEHTEALGQRIGIIILLMLMSLAFYNDIARLLN